LIGSEEVVVNSVDDIMKVAYKVENERFTSSTAMNLNSSRTHAMIEFRRYRKQGNDLFINAIRFFDLAGAERFEKAQPYDGKVSQAKIEAIMTNWSLQVMSRVIDNCANLKKPLIGG